jgi:hypothetical protein
MMYLALSKEVSLIAGMPPIIAVRLPNGELSATLRSLCDLLDLNQRGQIQRIRRNPSLAEALQEAIISTPGGPQQADVLLNWAISIWATGLQSTRLPEAKQAAVKVLQREAFAAIRQAFVKAKDDASASEAAAPPPRASEAAESSLRQIRQGLLLAVQGVTNFEVEHQALVERVAALEGGPTGSTIGVLPQRLAHVYLLANRARQRYGYPIAATLAGLAEHFHAADVYDLPERDWSAILDWFASVLEEW